MAIVILFDFWSCFLASFFQWVNNRFFFSVHSWMTLHFESRDSLLNTIKTERSLLHGPLDVSDQKSVSTGEIWLKIKGLWIFFAKLLFSVADDGQKPKLSSEIRSSNPSHKCRIGSLWALRRVASRKERKKNVDSPSKKGTKLLLTLQGHLFYFWYSPSAWIFFSWNAPLC